MKTTKFWLLFVNVLLSESILFYPSNKERSTFDPFVLAMYFFYEYLSIITYGRVSFDQSQYIF